MLPQKFSAATTCSREAPPASLLTEGDPSAPQPAANAATARRIAARPIRGRACLQARPRERERYQGVRELITLGTISRLSLVLSSGQGLERRADHEAQDDRRRDHFPHFPGLRSENGSALMRRAGKRDTKAHRHIKEAMWEWDSCEKPYPLRPSAYPAGCSRRTRRS